MFTVQQRLCVCRFVWYPHHISNIDAPRITKCDIDMVHHEFWKPIYFGVKRSKVKDTMHKKTFPPWVKALFWVPASSGFILLHIVKFRISYCAADNYLCRLLFAKCWTYSDCTVHIFCFFSWLQFFDGEIKLYIMLCYDCALRKLVQILPARQLTQNRRQIHHRALL